MMNELALDLVGAFAVIAAFCCIAVALLSLIAYWLSRKS